MAPESLLTGDRPAGHARLAAALDHHVQETLAFALRLVPHLRGDDGGLEAMVLAGRLLESLHDAGFVLMRRLPSQYGAEADLAARNMAALGRDAAGTDVPLDRLASVSISRAG